MNGGGSHARCWSVNSNHRLFYEPPKLTDNAKFGPLKIFYIRALLLRC